MNIIFKNILLMIGSIILGVILFGIPILAAIGIIYEWPSAVLFSMLAFFEWLTSTVIFYNLSVGDN